MRSEGLRVLPRQLLLIPLILSLSLWLSSCVLTNRTDMISGDFRSQSASEYIFEAAAESQNRLLVLPFNVSLQRHFLIRDPQYQRDEYRELNQSIAAVVKSWSDQHELDLQLLDAGVRENLFASQRLTSTSIRLLNKKSSVDAVPALPDLMENLELADDIQTVAGVSNSTAADAPDLIMAGTYTGHLKSDGQLFKEKISRGLRYLGSFGRQQIRRPASGFGKLFVVLLDADSGKLLWFGDADAAPGTVDFAMAALLSQIGESGAQLVNAARFSQH